MTRLRWPESLALAGLLALAQGCAEELGPERWETTQVSGVVRLGASPVTNGWIEFLPTDGTVGTMCSAPLGPDGRFTADGVAVGWNRIGIAGAAIGIAEIRRCFDPLGSPIRRRITKPSTGPLAINLIDEYALWLVARRSQSDER